MPAYAAMAAAFRERDQTRLVSWATNRVNASIGWSHGLLDLNLHLADIVAFNWYPGWYECHVPGCNTINGCTPPTPAGPSCLAPTPQNWWQAKAEWAAAAYPSKPFIISETGAGAIAGWHNGTSVTDYALHCRWPGRDEPCWSEEFQRDIVRSQVTAVVGNSSAEAPPPSTTIAGLSLWLLFDSQDNRGNCSTAQCHAQLDTWRPHALNNKGICSAWREPKLAYHAVSDLFRGRAS